MARSTGKRCGLDALQGATACRVHGGFRMAYRASSTMAAPWVSSVGLREPRRALARLGATLDETGDRRPLPVSIIERGRIVERGERIVELDLTDAETGGK
jgi:hypothetical protein